MNKIFEKNDILAIWQKNDTKGGGECDIKMSFL